MAMRHAVQDAADAAARALAEYIGHWHPILAAVEVEPGVWEMTAQYGRRYAVIRALEVAGERGYRAVTWAEQSEDRQLIGYYRTLRAACAASHRLFVRSHGPAHLSAPAMPRSP
ncbi:MAG: hypothetical protein ABWX59_01685 [Microbacteriaceae bacterium]